VASSTSKLVEASTTSAAKGSVTTAVPSALASVRRDEERISEVASGTNFMVKNNEYLPAADAMPAVRSAVRQRCSVLCGVRFGSFSFLRCHQDLVSVASKLPHAIAACGRRAAGLIFVLVRGVLEAGVGLAMSCSPRRLVYCSRMKV